jgi:choline kinase
MKVIIMAAGVGKRLLGINKNKPKCLITVNGETLISRIVRLFHEQEIRDISIVVGYQGDLIRNELKDKVQYFENSIFSTTNSIMSLWCAKDVLAGDVILLNADLYYEASLLDYMLKQTKQVVMLADSTRIEGADYRFGFEGDHICRFGKHLDDNETDGEYVGMARINKSFIKTFKQTLEKMIAAEKHGSWWEDVLYSFIGKQIHINYRDVAGIFWTEVDTHKDYDRLQSWVKKNEPLKQINVVALNN